MNLRIEYDNAVEGINKSIIRVETLISVLTTLYENKLSEEEFIIELQMIQADLLKHVNKLNDIAMHAIAVNDAGLYYRCEDKKLEVRNVMDRVRGLYM
jgi:hypothetical protein